MPGGISIWFQKRKLNKKCYLCFKNYRRKNDPKEKEHLFLLY